MFSNAAHRPAIEPRATVGPHDDQVRVNLGSHSTNHLGGIAILETVLESNARIGCLHAAQFFP